LELSLTKCAHRFTKNNLEGDYKCLVKGVVFGEGGSKFVGSIFDISVWWGLQVFSKGVAWGWGIPNFWVQYVKEVFGDGYKLPQYDACISYDTN